MIIPEKRGDRTVEKKKGKGGRVDWREKGYLSQTRWEGKMGGSPLIQLPGKRGAIS